MVLPCLNALPVGTDIVDTLPLLESSLLTRIFLSNEKASHLYTPGMTIEQAEEAVRRDPDHIRRAVMTFLGNEKASDLYTPRMTIEQAEEAVRQWKFEKKQQRKEEKRKKKQARVAKADDLDHQMSKLKMIERTKSVAQAEEAARISEEERIKNMRKNHKDFMRRRAMDEVDTDGESD